MSMTAAVTVARAPAPPQQASAMRRRAVAPTPAYSPVGGPRWSIGAVPLHPKLRIGAVDDPEEHEADRVADAVMRMPDPAAAEPPAPRPCAACAAKQAGTLRRKCEACEEEDGELMRAAAGRGAPAASPAPPSVTAALAGPGHAMDSGTRAFFEPRFGRDLSHVRLHTNAEAARSARDVGALAYAVGSQIAFGEGRYAPGSPEGKRLIAHELAHVLQDGQGAALRRQPPPGGAAPPDPAATATPAPADPTATPAAAPDPTATPAAPDPPMSRAEEIQLSKSSPGAFTGEADPLTLSLFNFAIDVATPKTEHTAVLKELGTLLGTRATAVVQVRSIGFADSTGSEIHNLALSQQRADAVKALLQPQISQRVTITGYGESNPVASNDTVSGRSRNRRVDLRFAAVGPPPPQPVPPQPQPQPVPQPQPQVQPPPGGGGGGKDDDKTLCETIPLICGLGIPVFLLPLICVIAPEACIAVGCALLPPLCAPPPPPPPPKPPEEPPEKPPGGPLVTFVPAVRAGNTPDGMPDRIGLRDPVHVSAVVVAPQPLTAPITIEVDGTSRQAGDATVNGQHNIQITATTLLEVKGIASSAANFAFSPFLQLGAWYNGALVGDSNRFGVSAIMQNWTAALDGVDTTRFGHAFYTIMDWVSDSGNYRDLDECRHVERVAVVAEEGGMTGMGPGDVSDPNVIETGDLHPVHDQHGTEHQYTRTAGRQLLKQLFTMRDMRVNGGWVGSPASGFEIERKVERDIDDPKCWQLTVTKRGAAVSIGAFHSSAGSGNISHRFGKLNCETPPTTTTPPTTPTPEPTPTPVPTPQTPSATPPCDRAELSRRVDACVDAARHGAIRCTLGLVGFGGGAEGVGVGLDYLGCLELVRELLLECDRRAKQDTHCPDGDGQDQQNQERLASAAGLPPPQAAGAPAQSGPPPAQAG